MERKKAWKSKEYKSNMRHGGKDPTCISKGTMRGEIFEVIMAKYYVKLRH